MKMVVGDVTDQIDVGVTPFVFQLPQKYIKSENDIKCFKESSLFHNLVDFINQLSSPLKGFPIDSHRFENASQKIQRLVELLNVLDSWIDDIPLSEGVRRFGNRAFQTWFDKLGHVSN